MSADVEDVLREAMRRLSAELRVPAGLTRRAVRRRRRRLVLRSAAGLAAALTAGAVAVAAIGIPGTRFDGARQPAVNTADVVKRVDRALSAVGPGRIAQMTVTTRRTVEPGGATVTITSRIWSYNRLWRLASNWPAGQSHFDVGFKASSACTLVNYQTRTWASQSGSRRRSAPQTPGVSSCDSLADAVPGLFPAGLLDVFSYASSPPATVAAGLRAEISGGSLTVAGRQRVDGIEAIKLTSRPGSRIDETIWVDPATYLLVAVVVRPPGGQPGPWQAAEITWLRPTAQNQAKLDCCPFPPDSAGCRWPGPSVPEPSRTADRPANLDKPTATEASFLIAEADDRAMPVTGVADGDVLPMTAQQRAEFESRGYLLVRNALSEEEVAFYATALDRVYAAQQAAGRVAPGGAMHLLSAVAHCQEAAGLIDHPRVFGLVWSVLGWNVHIYHSHLDVHPPVRAGGRSGSSGIKTAAGRTGNWTGIHVRACR